MLQQVLGRAEARADNGLDGALEEDARLTALFLWTLQNSETGDKNEETKKADEEAIAKTAARGLTLPFDVVRRFAQPMGIDLDVWTNRIIDQSKGVVRLLPVAERAANLFGMEGAAAAADWIETDPQAGLQRTLFPETQAPRPGSIRKRRSRKALLAADAELQNLETTTLDPRPRSHAAAV